MKPSTKETIRTRTKTYIALPLAPEKDEAEQNRTRKLFLSCLTMPQTTKLCKEFFPAVFGTFRPGDKHKTRVYRLVTHLQNQPHTVVQAVHEHVRNQKPSVYDQMTATR